jgi:hypothetical protein
MVLAGGEAVWTGYWGKHATSRAGERRHGHADTLQRARAARPHDMTCRQQLRCGYSASAAAQQQQQQQHVRERGVQRDTDADAAQRSACRGAHTRQAALKINCQAALHVVKWGARVEAAEADSDGLWISAAALVSRLRVGAAEHHIGATVL